MKTAAPQPASLAVCPGDDLSRGRAAELAKELELPLLPLSTDPRCCNAAGALLQIHVNGIALQITGKQAPGPVSVDFGASNMRHRRGAGHNELLGKAVGIGKKEDLHVLDATAGLGRDSFVLADLGAQVTLCERHPVVAAMLRSGLELAQDSSDPWLAVAAARMTLVTADARVLTAEQLNGCDVIYLDPMFRQRDRRAAVKKEMALFQFLLEDEPETNDHLLEWALARPVARVVVKRPSKAAPLANITPSHSIRGKAVRYDVHVLSGLN